VGGGTGRAQRTIGWDRGRARFVPAGGTRSGNWIWQYRTRGFAAKKTQRTTKGPAGAHRITEAKNLAGDSNSSNSGPCRRGNSGFFPARGRDAGLRSGSMGGVPHPSGGRRRTRPLQLGNSQVVVARRWNRGLTGPGRSAHCRAATPFKKKLKKRDGSENQRIDGHVAGSRGPGGSLGSQVGGPVLEPADFPPTTPTPNRLG